MAYQYEVRTKKAIIGGEDLVRYYASPVHGGQIDTSKIAQELSERSTLNRADVHAAIVGLTEIMEQYLHQGYTVKLDGLGVFSLSITSDGFEKEGDCQPRHVRAARICFKASSPLRKGLKKVVFARKKGIKPPSK